MLNFMPIVYIKVGGSRGLLFSYEPHHEKTRFVHMRKKGVDQRCSHCTADQRFCFRYADSTIPLLLRIEISSLWLFSVTEQPNL